MYLKIVKLEYAPIDGKWNWRKVYHDGSYSRWYPTDLDVDQGSYLIDVFLRRKASDLPEFEEPDRDETPPVAFKPPIEVAESPKSGDDGAIIAYNLKRLDHFLSEFENPDKTAEGREHLNRAAFETYYQLRALGAKQWAAQIVRKHGIDPEQGLGKLEQQAEQPR